MIFDRIKFKHKNDLIIVLSTMEVFKEVIKNEFYFYVFKINIYDVNVNYVYS